MSATTEGAVIQTPTVVERLRLSIASATVGESLRARVFRGGAWLGAGSFTEQVMRFGRNMVLTRLLAPEAFGEMAIVLSACSVIHTIMDIGVREALIQNPRGSEEDYVGAAWWMAFGRAVTFWAILSLTAPFIAKFYHNPELSKLFLVAAVGVLIDGAISSRAYVAIREMNFRHWAIINHGGAIIGVLITLGLSVVMRNVWALVVGNAAESCGRFVFSYIVCPYLPPRRLPTAAIRDLLTFSKKAFGLSLLNLIFARTDIFVLAKMFSPAELGLYTMAVFLVQTPTGFLMNLLGQTLLPTFSQFQDDDVRSNRVLMQVTSALLLIGMPALIFTTFCGRSLLEVFYGRRYTSAVVPLTIASFVALFNAVNGQLTIVYYARGRPELHRRCVFITSITMIVLIYPLVKWFGLSGGQLAALVAIIAGLLFQVVRMRNLTKLNVFAYMKKYAVFGSISFLVAVIYLGMHAVGLLVSPALNILVGILACATACGLGLITFDRAGLKESA